MKILRQRSVSEDLGLLVLGVFGEREGVVSGGAAENDESAIAEVLTKLGVEGGGRRWRRNSGKGARGIQRGFGNGGGGWDLDTAEAAEMEGSPESEKFEHLIVWWSGFRSILGFMDRPTKEFQLSCLK